MDEERERDAAIASETEARLAAANAQTGQRKSLMSEQGLVAQVKKLQKALDDANAARLVAEHQRGDIATANSVLTNQQRDLARQLAVARTEPQEAPERREEEYREETRIVTVGLRREASRHTVIAMDIRNVGGTPGGTRTFILGMIMMIVGGYLLLDQVTVFGGYWNWGSAVPVARSGSR